jgi:hypothetical protein
LCEGKELGLRKYSFKEETPEFINNKELSPFGIKEQAEEKK